MEQPQFVTVTNVSKKTFTLYPKLPKQDKHKVEIEVAPGRRTPPLPYDRLLGSRGWKALADAGRVRIEDVPPWRPAVVTVKNLSRDAISVDVALPPQRNNGQPQERPPKRYKVGPGRTSPRVSLRSLANRAALQALAAGEQVSIKPVPYIGPALSRPPCIGSFGGDDVYSCYRCGQPIVIRYHPPRPIHI